MTVRFKSMLLMTLVLISFFGVQRAHAQTDAAKIKSKVTKYGVGKKVTVTHNDKTKVKGRITSIDPDSFSLRKSDTGNMMTFDYDEVARVKKRSYTKWIVLGAAAAVGVAILIPLSKRCRNEGGSALCL